MIFIPAHRSRSLDAWWRPNLRADDLPGWSLFLLHSQVGIVYFFGGIAKINEDWLAGEPMRTWLAARTHYALVGPFFAEEWCVQFMSYGGLLLDLFIVPLLLWRRTRILAFAMAVSFHLMNAWLFMIGIFPWFMIVATTLFFDPDWPRRFFSWISRWRSKVQPAVAPIVQETVSGWRLRGLTAVVVTSTCDRIRDLTDAPLNCWSIPRSIFLKN